MEYFSSKSDDFYFIDAVLGSYRHLSNNVY